MAAVLNYIAEQRADLAAVGRSFSEAHSSSQVLLMTNAEMWDTMALSWAAPGSKPTIEEIADTWNALDLAACVVRLGLPLLPASMFKAMRKSIVTAVRKHAAEHPLLFVDGDAELELEASDNDAAANVPVESLSPPRAAAAARVVPPSPHRRSPRDNLSSRAAAAAAVAAMNAYMPQPRQASANMRAHASAAVAVPRRVASTAAFGAVSAAAAAAPRGLPSLLEQLADEDSDPSSDSSRSSGDEDTADEHNLLSRNAGRASKAEISHHLANAGIPRSFAKGFIRNAQYVADGRSMFQLYTELVASFPGDKQHCVRECLALARVLDALLKGDNRAALEAVCRRLGGVHTAAETGNWAMCERLESQSNTRSFVPESFMRSALKDVTRMAAVKKSVSSSGTGRSAAGAAGYSSSKGGKGRSSDSRPYSRRDNNSDTKGNGAGASYKKKGGSDPK